MTQGSSFRLPRTVTPSRYAIELRLDPGTPTFDGTLDAAVTVHESVSEIVLNGTEITVAAGALVGDDEQVIEIGKVVPDAEAGRLTLELPSELEPGDYALRLEFTGRLSDLMEGMYRSRYTDDAGEDHVIITTHFEATDARRNFPCWDEPDLKATFAMTLVVPEGLTALTNTPEIGREPADPGFERIRFAESMVMSTYLVCVVVGDLALTDPVFAGPVPIRVACRPDRVHLAGYANEVAVFSLTWFGEYYDIPYPEQKLDQAAIPDFAQGAMENTGLGHVSRDAPAARSRPRRPRGAPRCRRDGCPRARPHVVRGSRDDAVVERHLAERGVRHVHVVSVRRRDGAVVARVRFVPRDPHDRVRGRRARHHKADRVPGRIARRGERHVRHAHVHEGRGRVADDRAVARPRAVPRRHPPLPRDARLREHRDAPPVGRAGGRERPAGAPHHGCVDLPAGLPRDRGAPRSRRGAPDTAPLRAVAAR